MAGKANPGALAGATGAGNAFHAKAAGTQNIAQGKARAKRAGLYHIQPEGGEAFTIQAKGRDAWALDPATLAALGLAGACIWGALA